MPKKSGIPKIKICGITNLADARLAVELDADFLGFNFYQPSPRYIEPQAARDIIAALTKRVETVGVFVNAGVEGIAQVGEECPLTIAQLHGDESNEDCRVVGQLGLKVMKAVRVRQPGDIEQLAQYDVEMVLLDAFREELYGGTGHRFDWSWITQHGGKKIFLAGGITPNNIVEALAVGTYGIDLCSGVEKERGIKDAGKMRALFQRIATFRA